MTTKREIRIIPKSKDPLTPLIAFSMKQRWALEKAVARVPNADESGEVVYLDLPSNTHITFRDDALAGPVLARLRT